MKKAKDILLPLIKIILGCALFGLGFGMFLIPSDLNAGGLSGLSMVLVHFIGHGSVGTITALLNLPLFIIGGFKIGKKFLIGSLIGMVLSSTAIDLFTMLPAPQVDPLMGAIYGGAICGVGLGMVFSTGASTGGSDIIVRLLKKRWQHVPIGTINTIFDACVAILTGVVFMDISRALYSGIAIFLCGQIIDAVVYRFDYSKVALIITKEHQAVAGKISHELDRGVTYLQGEGYYSHQEFKVILTAVKRHQIASLKQLVVDVDPNAFIIVQEAHQVLGDGFSRYSKDGL